MERGWPVKLMEEGPSAEAGAGAAAAGEIAARGGSVGAGPEIGGAGGGAFEGLRTAEFEGEEKDDEDDGKWTPAAVSWSWILRFFAPGLPCPALLAAMRASSGGGAVSGKFT